MGEDHHDDDSARAVIQQSCGRRQTNSGDSAEVKRQDDHLDIATTSRIIDEMSEDDSLGLTVIAVVADRWNAFPGNKKAMVKELCREIG